MSRRSDPQSAFAEAERRIAQEAQDKTGNLDLSNLALTQLPPLQSVAHLQHLNLRGTQISDLAPLSGLTSLQRLDVSNTQISDLAPLRNLTSLQRLDVSNTQISDLAPLRNLTSLQTLCLSLTQVSDLSPLSRLTFLQTLFAYSTQVSDLAPLRNLTSLQTLFAYSTQVSDLAPLRNLTSLKGLYLSFTQVSDLAPLRNLTSLQRLDVNNTQISDLDPLRNLTSLQRLDVNNTQISDLDPLSGLTSLKQLSLSNTQISDLAPLRNLTSLQTLFAYSTQVSDLAPLRNLTSLKGLYLSFTQVSDLAPLRNLTSLQLLDASNTEVSDLSPLEKKTFRHLSLINLGVVTGLDLAFFEENFYEADSEDLRPDAGDNFRFDGTYPCRLLPELLMGLRGADLLRALLLYSGEKASEIYPTVKALLLGNGQVGKTSFLKALAGQRGEKSKSTHGIDVWNFDLDADLGLKQCQDPPSSPSPDQLHLWDFGGQDLYHETHRHYMKQAAVYILAWNLDSETRDHHVIDGHRFPNHNLLYWLDLIKRHSPTGARLVLLQTQADRVQDGELPANAQNFLETLAQENPQHLEWEQLTVDFLSENRISKTRERLYEIAKEAKEKISYRIPKDFVAALSVIQQRCEQARQDYAHARGKGVRDDAKTPPWLMTLPEFEDLCTEQAGGKMKYPTLEGRKDQAGFFTLAHQLGPDHP